MTAQSKVRQIKPSERRWACGKLGQFCGRFELDAATGLWFSLSTSASERQRIGGAFFLAPRQLREHTSQFGLTVSTSTGRTAHGHAATLYGDWHASRTSDYSPHLELGSNAMRSTLIAPYMVHELAHLWWNCLRPHERKQYAAALQASMSRASVEITEYVQDKYSDWFSSLSIKEGYGPAHRESYLKRWVEESYADSVAVLAVPGYAWKMSTIDLSRRRQMIAEVTGLRALGRITAAQIAALPALKRDSEGIN